MPSLSPPGPAPGCRPSASSSLSCATCCCCRRLRRSTTKAAPAASATAAATPPAMPATMPVLLLLLPLLLPLSGGGAVGAVPLSAAAKGSNKLGKHPRMITGAWCGGQAGRRAVWQQQETHTWNDGHRRRRLARGHQQRRRPLLWNVRSHLLPSLTAVHRHQPAVQQGSNARPSPGSHWQQAPRSVTSQLALQGSKRQSREPPASLCSQLTRSSALCRPLSLRKRCLLAALQPCPSAVPPLPSPRPQPQAPTPARPRRRWVQQGARAGCPTRECR